MTKVNHNHMPTVSPFSDAKHHCIMLLFPYSLKSLLRSFPRNVFKGRRGEYNILLREIGRRLVEDVGVHETL